MDSKKFYSDEFCDIKSEHSGLGSRYAYISMKDFVVTNPPQKKIKSFIENFRACEKKSVNSVFYDYIFTYPALCILE